MRQFLTIGLLFYCMSSYSQQQWFPSKLGNADIYIADTSGGFPVSFIEFQRSKVVMYGYHTNYPTPMKLTKTGYYSSHLTIPVQDTSIRPYAKAKYYFTFKRNKGILTIRISDKTESIIFIKSTKPFKNINSKWG